MGLFSRLFTGKWGNINRYTQDWIRGLRFYPLNMTTQYNDLYDLKQKLKTLLESPALLTVFTINSDLFSLGKAIVKDANGEILKSHPLYEILKKPNFFDTEMQFLWDFMFWNMFGNAYVYCESKSTLTDNNIYFLNNSKIEFAKEMTENADKLYLSKREAQRFIDNKIIYKYDNGTEKQLPFKKIIHFTDTTSTTKAWFQGSSRLEALYKVVSNSELSLDAKNTELLFSKKYMVAGKTSETDLDNPMMMPDEKKYIEYKTLQENPVTAVRSMIDIKKFVEDLKSEKLDKSFMQDVFTIARLYNIPKDVIEVNFENGAKYENKKYAVADHVDYTLKPKGDEFLQGLMNYFGFEGKAEMSWSHMPFMQVREIQKNESKKLQAEAFRILIDAGVDPEDAQKEIGYQFQNPVNYVQVRNTTTPAQS